MPKKKKKKRREVIYFVAIVTSIEVIYFVAIVTSEPSLGCLNFHERKPVLLHNISFQKYHGRKVASDFKRIQVVWENYCLLPFMRFP